MIIELKSSSSIAKINSKGAELISYKDVFGTEYMWQADPNYWGKTSPVLFPIVGNLKDNKTIINEQEYSISKHGFCRTAEFKVMYQSNTKVILNYSFNEETLKVYPYKFSFTLTYTLEDDKITITYTVLNLDDKEIDYTFGAHPGFNVPLYDGEKFEDYCIEFNKTETEGSIVYDLEKLEFNVNNRVNLLENGNRLKLKYDLFDNDAIAFDKLNSDSVKLCNIKTGRGIQIDFQGFDFIAFWTPIKANAPFLCIEPWNGIAACSDEGYEFTKKRAIKHLKVNEQHSFNLSIIPV